ncbi:DUF624 domain-containing protein [Acidaminobacter sp. JC074]|uniref:YesL family protein n=1 Tax=Acidaminobacter sp. JC074 TaxID=2530199 RepID=UPI001F10EA43|nr:YesL family protein [Acidaminobacter sp. JC074]MCH4886177.1 DUF624 domain-containing protein [Acidaminobacter sp. JC074]
MEAKYNRNNIFMTVMTLVYQLMLLNILFLVFSMPIVTIGASSRALAGCIRDLLRGELSHEFKSFLYYFKGKFKTSTLSFLLLLLGYCIVVINLTNVQSLGYLLGMIQLPVIIQLLVSHMMLSYVVLEWDLKTLKSLKLAWILGNRNIIKIIGATGLMYVILKLSLNIPVILIFFYMPITSIIQYYFCYPTILKVKGDNS